jgi:hypothetical protein
VPPWGKPVSELVMSVLHGKRMWAFLKDQRRTIPEGVVISGDGGIPLSLAFGICQALRIPRVGTIYRLDGDPDEKYETPAPNGHVFETTKETRSAVV